MLAQTHLAPQSLEDFDVNKITPLNPEIISRQATINIGTIGHVAHGKSTLVRAVSEQNVSEEALKNVFNRILFRLCVTSENCSEILRSNLDMRTPNSTNARHAHLLSASNHMALSSLMTLNASLRAATLIWYSTGMSLLLIAQVTILSWLPCLPVQLLWTLHSCLLQEINLIRSHKRESI